MKSEKLFKGQIHIHVFWIPAIHGGMTAYFNSIVSR